MSGITIRVKPGYLERMSARTHFRGERNRRKVMICLALLSADTRLSADKLYDMAGYQCSYSGFRACLCRLAKWRYVVKSLPDTGGLYRKGTVHYSLGVKGGRLLYLCQNLAPQQYAEWQKQVRPLYTGSRNRNLGR